MARLFPYQSSRQAILDSPCAEKGRADMCEQSELCELSLLLD